MALSFEDLKIRTILGKRTAVTKSHKIVATYAEKVGLRYVDNPIRR